MKKNLVLLVFLVFCSGQVVSHNYANTQLECWEQTMCHQPGEYQNVDYMDKVHIHADEGKLWNGTIDIRNVTFMHNFSEKVENTGFQSIEQDPEVDDVDTRVTFDGIIRTESLCNEPVFDVDILKSSKYTINVYGNDTYGVRSCYNHPVKVEYSLTLDTISSEMEVVVNQSNVTESFNTGGYEGLPRAPEDQERFENDAEDRENQDKEIPEEYSGFLTGAINLFSNFF